MSLHTSVFQQPANGTPVTAVPNTGYHFVNWSDASTVNPRTDLNVTRDTTVTANFSINTYLLTVSKAGSGSGTVTSDLGGIACGSSCSESYDHGTTVTLTATPQVGSTFVGWTGSGCTGTSICVVTMDQAKSVTATFTRNQYTLSISTIGNGSVTKNPNLSTYEHGSSVTLTAIADVGYTFTGWSGDAIGSTNPLTLEMDGNKSITATFTILTYPLTVTRGGSGSGTVTSDLGGIVCGSICSETYNYGTNVTLTATPDASSTFAGWSGGCFGTSTCVVTMTQPRSVSATFVLKTYTLTYTAGTNGSITGSSPQTVNHGSDGTAVTAVPNSGYHFVNWSDASTVNPRTDVNVQGNISVTANFAINTYTLTYTAGANGSTTGTSPQTVNHGSNGATVTAVPNTGYHFVNWSDASTVNPRTDINVQGNISVTANFAINIYTLTDVTQK